jgi:hypothetical protein
VCVVLKVMQATWQVSAMAFSWGKVWSSSTNGSICMPSPCLG